MFVAVMQAYICLLWGAFDFSNLLNLFAYLEQKIQIKHKTEITFCSQYLANRHKVNGKSAW